MIERANEALRAKGYSPAQLSAVATPLPGRVLLKGTKILSPFADAEETILRAVEECVPSLEKLGRKVLTPRELRDCLDRSGAA